jgi:hypothetical protein
MRASTAMGIAADAGSHCGLDRVGESASGIDVRAANDYVAPRLAASHSGSEIDFGSVFHRARGARSQLRRVNGRCGG